MTSGSQLPLLCTCALLLLVMAPPGASARTRLPVAARQKGGQTRGQDGGQNGGQESVSITTAQCFSHCFTQLDLKLTSDKDCQRKPACRTCVHMCELLQTSPALWRRACHQETCDKGCQTACSHNFTPTHQPPGKWAFPADPSIRMIDSSTAAVRWQKPRPITSEGVTSRKVTFVYVIQRQQQGRWVPIQWTLSTRARIQGTPSERYHHFRLIAVSPEVIAANATLPEVPGDDGKAEVHGNADDSSGEVPSAHAPPQVESMPPGVLSAVSARLRTTTSGHVDAVVSWEQRLDRTLDGSTYVITWSHENCNVNETFPHCPLPASSNTMNFTVNRKKSVQVSITRLLFNTRYTIDVGFSQYPAERVHVTTQPCPHPDATYRHCPELATDATRSLGFPMATGNKMASSGINTATSRSKMAPSGTRTVTSRSKMATAGQVRRVQTDKSAQGAPSQGVTSPRRSTVLAAALASFIGVATVVMSVATYAIYRRWVKNRQAATLRSLRMDSRALWTPAGTLTNMAGTPGSFRRNPLSAQLDPSDLDLLRAFTTRPQMQEQSPPGPEIPRALWTRWSQGQLQHMTLTPEVIEVTPARSAPVREERQLLRTSTVSRVPKTITEDPSRKDKQGHDLPQGQVQGQTHFGGTKDTSISFRLYDLHLSSIREEDPQLDLENGGDLDLDDVDLDLVTSKCCTDFSESLRLSAVDADCFLESEGEEDGFLHSNMPTFISFKPPTDTSFSSSSCPSTSFSTQEGSYRFYEDPGAELAPFLARQASDSKSGVTEEEMRPMIVTLNESYESYSV